MRTSEVGIDLIRRNEGCRLTAYLDTLAKPPVWTIGFGCTGPGVHDGVTITQAQAGQMLADRLEHEFESGVLAALQGAPVSQPQFDAMVSLSYNIGVGNFTHSSVAQRHRAGDYRGAGDAFLWWNKAGGAVLSGLQRRRAEERELYLSGVDATQRPEAAAVCDIDADLVADLVRALQRVVDTTPDGQLGPKTFAAIQQVQRSAA